VIGHGADMTVRTPGGDHQTVGDGGFALEVDEYDVLSLVVVETGQDQVLQRTDAVLDTLGRVFGRRLASPRTGRSFTGQRGAPLSSQGSP
jgi:hypothetical protein